VGFSHQLVAAIPCGCPDGGFGVALVINLDFARLGFSKARSLFTHLLPLYRSESNRGKAPSGEGMNGVCFAYQTQRALRYDKKASFLTVLSITMINDN